MAEAFISNIFNPVGILVANDGTVFLNTDTGVETILSKIAANGTVLNQVPISTGFFDIVSSVKLVFEPTTGSILGLRADGQLLSIDPNTLAATQLLDLRTLNINTSTIFDVATGTVDSFGGLIQPQFASYGDVAIRQNGDVTELFITGLSQAQSFPFVLRIRVQGGAVQEAKVILASRADALTPTSQSVRLERGIAVNAQGTVLTTLPIAEAPRGGIAIAPFDVAVAFNADFNPADGVSQNEAPIIALNGADIYSQGITTDAAGNFYIVTNSVGSATFGVPGEGALIAVSSTLDQVLGVESLGSIASTFRDVAIDPTTQRALVTASTFSVGPAADDLVVAFPLSQLNPVPIPENPIGIPGVIQPTEGDDTLVGSSRGDAFRGGAGNDILRGAQGRDRLRGDAGNDTLFGGSGRDRLRGDAGNDTLFGGSGRDRLRGDAGNDTLFGGRGGDTLQGDRGDDVLGGGRGNDALFGNAGDDILRGGIGNDTLFGANGNDILVGGTDDDLLNGGQGNNILIGGAGRDTFAIVGKSGVATVRDFILGVDVIGLVNNLTFSQLSLVQEENNTFVNLDEQTLAILVNVQANSLTEMSFVTV